MKEFEIKNAINALIICGCPTHDIGNEMLNLIG